MNTLLVRPIADLDERAQLYPGWTDSDLLLYVEEFLRAQLDPGLQAKAQTPPFRQANAQVEPAKVNAQIEPTKVNAQIDWGFTTNAQVPPFRRANAQTPPFRQANAQVEPTKVNAQASPGLKTDAQLIPPTHKANAQLDPTQKTSAQIDIDGFRRQDEGLSRPTRLATVQCPPGW